MQKTPGKMLSGNEKNASCLGRKLCTHDANEVWKIRLSFDPTTTMFFLDEKDVVFFDAFSLDVFHSQIANISDHQPTSDLRKH